MEAYAHPRKIRQSLLDFKENKPELAAALDLHHNRFKGAVFGQFRP